MKFTVCILALCTVCAVAKLASDVPLFLWSGEKYVNANNLGLSSALTTADIEALFDSVTSGNAVTTPFSKVLNKPQPEVFVIFVEPHLSLSQLVSTSAQLPVLQNVMQASAGSFYAPYVDLSDSLVSTVIHSASKIPTSASVIYAGKGATLLPELRARVPNVRAVSLNNLEKVLSTSKIFNNGVTDLVIVHLDAQESSVEQFSRANAVIQAVHSIISQKTSNYIDVYTALEADSVEDKNFQKRVYMDYSDFFIDDAANDTNGTNGTISWFQTFFPGWFWEVFLIFLFIVPIIITGYCQLMSIQTPMFEERKKVKRA